MDLGDMLTEWWNGPHGIVVAKAALCHPNRPLSARGLCRSCYEMKWNRGQLDDHPAKRTYRRRDEFVADYEMLRSEGYDRTQIAQRLGMTRSGLDQAYRRAIRAGALTPDRTRR